MVQKVHPQGVIWGPNFPPTVEMSLTDECSVHLYSSPCLRKLVTLPPLADNMSIIRPGVHTIISAPRFNSAICSEMPVPPYTHTLRAPRIPIKMVKTY